MKCALCSVSLIGPTYIKYVKIEYTLIKGNIMKYREIWHNYFL